MNCKQTLSTANQNRPSCLDLNLYSCTIHCDSHALFALHIEHESTTGHTLVAVTAKLWLHYCTGQTFKLTFVGQTHIKELGIHPDYHHIRCFSLRCFRSGTAIFCCAAVDHNRLSKSTASEENQDFHFPYITRLCKASLTTHTLSKESNTLQWVAYNPHQFSLIN